MTYFDRAWRWVKDANGCTKVIPASLAMIGPAQPMTLAQAHALRVDAASPLPTPAHKAPLPLRALRFQRQVIGLIVRGSGE